MRLIFILACLFVASPASALCIRSGLAYTFADEVNNSLAYIGCLYDDAAAVSRAHAEKINEHSDALNRQNVEIYKLMKEIDDLKTKADQFRLSLDIQRDEINELKEFKYKVTGDRPKEHPEIKVHTLPLAK